MLRLRDIFHDTYIFRESQSFLFPYPGILHGWSLDVQDSNVQVLLTGLHNHVLLGLLEVCSLVKCCREGPAGRRLLVVLWMGLQKGSTRNLIRVATGVQVDGCYRDRILGRGSSLAGTGIGLYSRY